MTLYCRCGFTKDMVCAHRWSAPEVTWIEIDKVGGTLSQKREKCVCKVCGAILSMNVTTGAMNILH